MPVTFLAACSHFKVGWITIEEFSGGATFVATYATSAALLWRSYPGDADCCFDEVDG
jgi:hypothetical protein